MEGRCPCTLRKVKAELFAECSSNWRRNSSKARGFLFWSCTRAGPCEYPPEMAFMPSFNIRSDISATRWWNASAVLPAAIPGTGNGKRTSPVGVLQPEQQRSIATHGEPADVGLFNFQGVQQAFEVLYLQILGVVFPENPARPRADTRGPRR